MINQDAHSREGDKKMDAPEPPGGGKREREPHAATLQRFPLHGLPRDVYNIFLAVLEDPLDVWAFYANAMHTEPVKGARKGMRASPSLRQWADEAGAWLYLLRERLHLPAALLDRYPHAPQARWLYFAYAFALQRPPRPTYTLWRGDEQARVSVVDGGNIELRSSAEPLADMGRMHMRWRVLTAELLGERSPERLFVDDTDNVRMTTYRDHTGTLFSLFNMDSASEYDTRAADYAYAGMLYAAFEAGFELPVMRGHDELRIKGCAACAAPVADRVCGACERVAYCGEECATTHWQSHGRECGSE